MNESLECHNRNILDLGCIFAYNLVMHNTQKHFLMLKHKEFIYIHIQQFLFLSLSLYSIHAHISHIYTFQWCLMMSLNGLWFYDLLKRCFPSPSLISLALEIPFLSLSLFFIAFFRCASHFMLLYISTIYTINMYVYKRVK